MQPLQSPPPSRRAALGQLKQTQQLSRFWPTKGNSTREANNVYHRQRICKPSGFHWPFGASGEQMNSASTFKTTLHLVKRAVQVTAGVSLFKDKVGDLRWCEGGSMLPTLNVTGDLLLQIPLSSVLNYSIRGDRARTAKKTAEAEPTTSRLNLNRGDLVNFVSPSNPSVLACKRIIGLPGDQILVDDLPHHFNQITADSILHPELDYQYSHKSLLTIPQGHLWLQGDNYAVSIDSRTYGPVPIGLVSGKIVARVWPNFTWLSRPFVYK
ncbi:hypothetical protein PGTUg99_009593 [Puccinia graminis f. sp. tritici]|uniref:Mitochondrial inner membrane protease subunit n=1 Tax=Puccinia graminis f. sp. tritici TaxID=56615 RepID=A0A5B0RLK5_PUCGR|nr:hypothetical protein PGTUg99_009593 [Puccinia graminis f. sp. tritici]